MKLFHGSNYSTNGANKSSYLPILEKPLKRFSKTEPCPHCGKPDWCYSIGELTVCKRESEPARGWIKTSKVDGEGTHFYATEQQKPYTLSLNRRLLRSPRPSQLELAVLPALPEDVPQYQTQGNIRTIFYPYSPELKVKRIEDQSSDGKWRKRPPKPLTLVGGKWQGSKGGLEWPAYRLSEAKQHGKGKWVLMVEGEKCVEFSRSVGLVAATFQGGSWTEGDIETLLVNLKRSKVQGVAYWPDNDSQGDHKRGRVQAIAARLQVPFAMVQPLQLWPEMPEKGDIADWIEQFPDLTLNQRLKQIQQALTFPEALKPEDEPEQDLGITQIVTNALYSDTPWICVKGKLYQWQGTYYKYSEDDVEQKKISVYLNQYQVVAKGGKVTFPYAKPSESAKCLEWVKIIKAVSSDQCNPSGINCTNGILKFNWKPHPDYPHPIPEPQLVNHSPESYYLFEPLVTYNPEANSAHCERMLSALDEPQKQVFLKTIAASLDLPTVRKYKGRLIKGLLLKGDGNNGKDTLREAVAILYGYTGLTGLSLNDFKTYDDGKKFALSLLENSRVNWASENTSTRQIDKLQSLKQVITGEGIHIERKHVDAYEKVINGVFLFNVNDIPNIRGALEAVLSRYAVLLFDRTYKKDAVPEQGEIEADPRFKYDRDWLTREVMPAFLNRIVQALQDLMRSGVDYRCTEQALKDIQIHNSHLFEFAQDAGLVEQPGEIMTAGEIWVKLKQWYIDTGTLEIQTTLMNKTIEVWHDLANPKDKNLTYINQIISRFLELFPKAKKVPLPRKNGYGIMGLAWNRDAEMMQRCSDDAVMSAVIPIPSQSRSERCSDDSLLFVQKKNNHVFSVGDRVTIALKKSPYSGQTGIIRGFDRHDRALVYEIPGRTNPVTFACEHLRLIQSELLDQ